jgi:hypothetical protein
MKILRFKLGSQTQTLEKPAYCSWICGGFSLVRTFERGSLTLRFTPHPSVPLRAPRWLSCGVIMTGTPHPSRLQDTCALSIASQHRTAVILENSQSDPINISMHLPVKKQVNLDRWNGTTVYPRRYRLRATHQVAHCPKRDCPRSLDHSSQVGRLPGDLQLSVGGKMCDCGRSISSDNPRGNCTSKFETRPALHCQHIFLINLVNDAIGVAMSSVSTVHRNSTTYTLQMMCMYA